MFVTAAEALGPEFNRLLEQGENWVQHRLIALAPFRRFVCANEGPLRRIAQNTTTMRWMSRYIDFIVRTSRADDGAS